MFKKDLKIEDPQEGESRHPIFGEAFFTISLILVVIWSFVLIETISKSLKDEGIPFKISEDAAETIKTWKNWQTLKLTQEKIIERSGPPTWEMKIEYEGVVYGYKRQDEASLLPLSIESKIHFFDHQVYVTSIFKEEELLSSFRMDGENAFLVPVSYTPEALTEAISELYVEALTNLPELIDKRKRWDEYLM